MDFKKIFMVYQDCNNLQKRCGIDKGLGNII